MKRVLLSLLFILSYLLTGCEKNSIQPNLTTQQLHELYPGDINLVDRIEIRSGSTGKLNTYTDKQQIQSWINEVSSLTFIPDPNQEGRVGFIFAVALFENEISKLSFTPNSTGGHYYLYNEELNNKIKELFD